MLKSEGILSFLKKDFAQVEKVTSSRHFLTLNKRNIPTRVLSAFQHRHLFLFFSLFWPCVAWKAQIAPLCCRCTTGNSRLPRPGASSPPERHTQDVAVSPFHWTNTDSHPALERRNNQSSHRPTWKSAPCMPPRTPTLAQLSRTFALLKLISSTKSFRLSSARFSSRWASSIAFLVRTYPFDFTISAREEFCFVFSVVVVVTPLVTSCSGAAVAGAWELPGVYHGWAQSP